MNPFEQQGTPLGTFGQWLDNNLLGGNQRIRQASDALQDPDAVKNWTRNTLISHGWSPEQAQWYADNVPVAVAGRDRFDQDVGSGGASGTYWRPTTEFPNGRIEIASDLGPGIDSTLPHEMVHAWDSTHEALAPHSHGSERLADVNQALSDMGPYGAITQWVGDRASDPDSIVNYNDLFRQLFTPGGSYGKGDPAHTTQYLYDSLGIPHGDIPDWYRQKYMGFLSGVGQ